MSCCGNGPASSVSATTWKPNHVLRRSRRVGKVSSHDRLLDCRRGRLEATKKNCCREPTEKSDQTPETPAVFFSPRLQVVWCPSLLVADPSWAAKRFPMLERQNSVEKEQQPDQNPKAHKNVPMTEAHKLAKAQSTKAHKGVPTAGTQARQGAKSNKHSKAPRLTRVFQLRAHKLAKGQTASTAKHQGSQGCSNCGHTSSPRAKQQAQQSTKAHKGVPTAGTQARQGQTASTAKHQGSQRAHVPTAGTQARQGASSGKAPRLTRAFQLRAHKLAKAQAAAKHQGSQECSNCGHTSSPRRKQRQSTKAHKSVPTAGTQACQGASSGKAPRLTRVFQLRAHKLAKFKADAV